VRGLVDGRRLLWLREEESEVSMHRTTRMWFGVAAVSALVLT
jgi:hypothetical protein